MLRCLLQSRSAQRAIITSSNSVRCIFTDHQLQIDEYINARGQYKKFKTDSDLKFFKKQVQVSAIKPDYDVRLLEKNLGVLLHIATASDMKLLKTTLHHLVEKRERYHGYKRDYGNLIMRLFHFLRRPQDAIDCIDNECISRLFTESQSYQILLDLLYKSGKYNDVLRIYNQLKTNRNFSDNKYIEAIILATFYRMNTSDAYEAAIKLWHSTSEEPQWASRIFVAALAVNQKQPEFALDIMKGEAMYTANRHIKLMAWIQTGQLNEIFKMLKSGIDYSGENVDCLISFEVMLMIEKLAQQRGLSEEKTRFQNIHNQLKSLNLITMQSFDDIICNPFKHEKADRTKTKSGRKLINE